MKSIIQTVQVFLLKHGLEPTSINLKVTHRGQVEVCTGKYIRKQAVSNDIAKAYRKKLVCEDYRFCNTELEITEDAFIITSN